MTAFLRIAGLVAAAFWAGDLESVIADETIAIGNIKQRTGRSDSEVRKLFGKVVNQEGQPVANAVVSFASRQLDIQASVTTDESGSFQIQLRFRDNETALLRIRAHSRDKSLIGFFRIPYGDTELIRNGLEISVGPTRTARVVVADQDGTPVSGAQVVGRLKAQSHIVGPIATNADGVAVLQLSEDDSIASLVTWKDGCGLDYRVYKLERGRSADLSAEVPEFPFASQETLTLGGAAPLSLTLTETKGIPISDARAHVWLLQKENEQRVNLSYFSDEMFGRTDENGSLVFEWFPAWQKSPVTIWPAADGFDRVRLEYDPNTDNGRVETELARLVAIRGSVTLPDGSPAVGVAVGARGAAYSSDYFRAATTTDGKGQYEILASPNQIYLLYVEAQKLAAPMHTGFAILPNSPPVEHDFQLQPATRIHGRVVNQKTDGAIGGHTVFLIQDGISLGDLPAGTLSNPAKSTRFVRPEYRRRIVTKDDGTFEFFAGPGEYRLEARGSEAKKITLIDGREHEVVLQVEAVEDVEIVFSGAVRDELTKQAVVGARITAVSRNFRVNDDWQAVTVKDGTFRVKRKPTAATLQIIGPDRKRGAIQEIDSGQTKLAVSLTPLGSAKATLMTADGSAPAANVKLRFGVNIEDIEGNLSSIRFGGVLTTDKDGRFSMDALVPGQEYQCVLEDNPGGYQLTVCRVTVKSNASMDLGKFNTPVPPQPYRRPTIAERTARAFGVADTPVERFRKEKELVSGVQQNLLVVFADADSKLAESLMRIRYESEAFREMSADFRFMAVPTNGDGLAESQRLAAEIGLEDQLEDSSFAVAVLNQDAEKVAEFGQQIVADDKSQIDLDRLLRRLDPLRTKPLDGHKLLADALAQATRDNKRVLVQETATWCGPCYMLSNRLRSNPDWSKDYIWVKMDHRWTGAREIMETLRDGANGGIPWFAILDADGKKLATSNVPGSGDNIGFPSSERGRKHFASMLRQTAQRMTEEEITRLATGTAEPQ